jgi:hypothetical protein
MTMLVVQTLQLPPPSPSERTRYLEVLVKESVGEEELLFMSDVSQFATHTMVS